MTKWDASLLLNFNKARLLVVGDVMLDSYWDGQATRISPEAPVPVVKVSYDSSQLGGAGNVAANIAALGARARLIGVVGKDETADRIAELLNDFRIVSNLVVQEDYRTVRKLRVTSRRQQLIRLDFEDEQKFDYSDVIQEQFDSALSHIDAIILSDYSKGVLSDVPSLIRMARSVGKSVIVDPKGLDFRKYAGATLITPNMSEFESVVGNCLTDEDIVIRGENLRSSLGLEGILITKSEKGMTLLENGKEALHFPACARQVFDVTGAGDTVISTIGVAVASGLNLASAVELSNFAAGIVVSKAGTASVSVPELLSELKSENSAVKYCEADVSYLVKNAKLNGELVVMTNGCFDILHPGHIDYLERARALGDRLVIAVNDDDSVRDLKGPDRPINDLSTRVRMLSALNCVDWVFAFSESEPTRVYCSIQPNILVKGGDYLGAAVAGSECVLDAGGRVEILNFVDGFSTSSLIEKIRNFKKS
jgi:D-beta-D-heptose 7-phosphate kinase/D-beta-D-heptose 1-phosphate adenosyltransferase